MRSNHWFSPANLEKAARDCEISDPNLLTSSGDFSSYAKANRGGGLVGSGIENHNIVDPHYRVQLYFDLIGRDPCQKIADIGCGLGFTSGALSEIFGTEDVIGYEVSLDAVQFAKKQWPRLKFIAGAIKESSTLDETYDLILAQEFYPFTRTRDFSVNSEYLTTLLQSLNSSGVLLISFAEGKGTILSNIHKLDDLLLRFNANLSIYKYPFRKIHNIVGNFFIASVFSNIVHYLTGMKRFCVLKIKVASNSA